jgi:hypothetical protein
MSTNQQNTEEEVDLGSLFTIIGKGFSKIFNFLGNIFKGIYHFFILILLFLKKHIFKISLAAIIGAGIGVFLEYKKETTYGSDLLLQPNFKSARQLYNNVNYYNDLVKQKNTTLLAKTFNINNDDASSLRSFKIEPIKTENDILSSYDELILSVDTLTVKSYSFDQFKRMYTDFDYKVHTVHVEAIKSDVFSNLDNVIISAIVENQYFDKVKTLTNENLTRTDSLLRKNLEQIDSLRKVYLKVMLAQANKESTGTTIDLGGQKETTKELELFETNKRISLDLKEVSEDISDKSEVINVISNFQPVGYEIKGIEKNYIFLLGALFASFIILFLLFKGLNNYLESYKK